MSDEGPIERRLDNGLRVLLQEVHSAPVVSCWAWYKVGGRNERPGLTGCSHWVEHMMFKGTERLAKGEVFRRVHRHGGYNNGFTTNDLTVYFETVPADKLEMALEIESDRMVNSRFDPAEVETERTVIISERQGAENSPVFLLAEEVEAAAYRVHPYGWPVVGWLCDLETMTREDLYTYYRTYYSPNNCLLELVGDFEADRALALVERYFGGLPAAADPPPMRLVEPPQWGERRAVVRRPGPVSYVQMAHHVPAAGHADFHPLVLLDAVLSGGKPLGFSGTWLGRSARLYRALVETKLATAVGSGFGSSIDPSLFSFRATVRRGVEPAAVEEGIVREIERLRGEPPSADELAKAVQQAEAQYAYSADGVTSRAFALGYFGMLTSPQDLLNLVPRLREVSPEDVLRVAQTYLGQDNRTVGLFVPSAPEEVEQSAQPETEPPSVGLPGPTALGYHFATGGQARPGTMPALQRFPLSGGGTLLVVEKPETPAVVVKGSLKAGVARERPEQAGVAQMCARLVQRGTARRTGPQIAEDLERLGAGLGFGAWLERTDCSGRCLARELPRLVETIAECWRTPSFPEAEVEKVRGEMLTALEQERDDTRAQAERMLREKLYPGGHAYGRHPLGRPEALSALGRAEIVEFHRAYYRPDTLLLVVVGGVRAAEARAEVERVLGDWATAALPFVIDAPAPRESSEEVFFEMAHKTQDDLALAYPAIRRDAPDYYALDMVNLVAGRLGLMGRLGEIVRDRLGLAYYVNSRLEARLAAGEWVVRAGVNPKNLSRAREAIREEMDRLTREPVSEEEFSDAKHSRIGGLALRLETAEGVAVAAHEIEYHSLGLDYLDRYPGIVAALTREELQAAAARYLVPSRAVEVVVGPRQG